jgi:hypothetical protein
MPGLYLGQGVPYANKWRMPNHAVQQTRDKLLRSG